MQLNPFRHRRIWLLLGWGLVVAVVVSSLIPLEVDLSHGRDKIAHLTAYGSMTFWFAILFRGRMRQIGIALAFAAMGVAIEYLQRMTSYRTFEVADMVANGIGATIGWTLAQTPARHAIDWAERLLSRTPLQRALDWTERLLGRLTGGSQID